MNYLRFAIGGLLLVAVLTLRPAGQTAEKKNSAAPAPQSTATADNRNREVPAAIRQRALAMLDPLFAATQGLKTDITKLYLQSQIADTIWDYDEALARRRFNDALQMVSSVDRAEPKGSVTLLSDGVPQLREPVLGWIAERDPAWARQLVLNELKGQGTKKTEILVLMRLTDVDAPRAVQIMKQALDKKEANWLRSFLEHLRQKDVSLADDVFSYALAAGPQDNDSPSDYFHELFGYAFPNAKVLDTNSPLSPDLVKRFLDFGCGALMKEADAVAEETKKSRGMSERAGYGYMDVVNMMPFFERYTPDAAPKILARWDEVFFAREGGREEAQQIKLLFGAKSVQELLSHVEQARDQEEREGIYVIATRRATAAGDIDQAFLILNRVEGSARQDLERDIHDRAAAIALANGDAEVAYRHGKYLSDLRTRTDLLSGVARLLCEKNETGRAAEIINEAQKAVEKEQEGPDKVMCMLMITNAAARLSPARGFECMKITVEAINRAKDSDGKPTVAISYDNFDENLLLLAESDFDRALALAKSITLKDAAIAAQVAVCRGVLLQKKPGRIGKAR